MHCRFILDETITVKKRRFALVHALALRHRKERPPSPWPLWRVLFDCGRFSEGDYFSSARVYPRISRATIKVLICPVPS